jgi:hypothetical protein
MDRERQIELDRSGEGLTKEEWDQGWHWCYEWDSMLVGPGMEEALSCSCSHHAIEAWKESPDGIRLREDLEKRLEQLDADWFNDQFRRTDGE